MSLITKYARWLPGATDALRTADWLTGRRVVAYAWMLVAAYGVAVAVMVATSRNLIDFNGKPLGTDFLSFWTAGSLALQGQAVSAYDWARHAAEERVVFGGAEIPYYSWSYPPLFLLAMATLARLSYGWALLVWIGLTGLGYLLCLGRIARHRFSPLVLTGFTAVFVNLGHGQNGFLSVALLAGGMLLLGQRPVAAGILFGLLAYKPQLGLLLPIALVAGGQWRAMAAATATVLVLAGASTAVFGLEIWPAFLSSWDMTRQIIVEQGNISRFPSF